MLDRRGDWAARVTGPVTAGSAGLAARPEFLPATLERTQDEASLPRRLHDPRWRGLGRPYCSRKSSTRSQTDSKRFRSKPLPVVSQS
jgi:hypothetical protein